MRVQLLVPAAGMGIRLGLNKPKALAPLAGRPMLAHTLDQFRLLDLVDHAVIVIGPGWREAFESVLVREFPGAAFVLAEGGAERQHSVANGLSVLDQGTEIVVIHDAARPFVAPSSIEESIAAAAECGAATVAVPCVDTILEADDALYLKDTPDRRSLWTCQTPQTFRVEVIREAHDTARRGGYLGTDDATLVRRMGGHVKLVQGTPLNFKITTPVDLALAEWVIERGLV